MIGLAVGMLLGILLRLALPPQAALLAIVPLIICSVVGWVIGKTLE